MLAINTWDFTTGTDKAWEALKSGKDCVDSVVAGVTQCELYPCASSVGFGGSINEEGNVSLDALVMDGRNHRAGSVAGLTKIKNAIGVARAVMQYTTHTLLVGDSATRFATQMGFKEETLETDQTWRAWKQWKDNNCQPNYRINVNPDPKKNCGPYTPNSPSGANFSPESTQFDTSFPEPSSFEVQKESESGLQSNSLEDSQSAKASIHARTGPKPKALAHSAISEENHDTIGMIVLDARDDLAIGTSTNGLNFKVPGRVGDTAIIGSGGYVENSVGACVGTGDGDILMRYSPCFQVVTLMSTGVDAATATAYAIARIAQDVPNYSGALLAYRRATHEVGAACFGFGNFPYSVRTAAFDSTQIVRVPCLKPQQLEAALQLKLVALPSPVRSEGPLGHSLRLPPNPHTLSDIPFL